MAADAGSFKNLLPPLVDGFTSNILAYAVLLAAIATITMALLELVKAMLRLRLVYQERMVKAWLKKDKEHADAYEQLVILSIADISLQGALFDQPTEKMMGQIQAAANVALDSPNMYPDIYSFLTKTSPVKSSEPTVQNSDAQVWKDFNKDFITLPAGQMPPDRIQKATQARSRLDHFVTRKLDALQTRVNYFWARLNQTISIIGSAIFISILLHHIHVDNGIKVFFVSIFGGMMAPFAKDVVTALSGLKAGK